MSFSSKTTSRTVTALIASPILILCLGFPFLAGSDRNLASVSQMKNWGIRNEITDSHIHAQEAWKLEEGSRDVVVAVVDTGIDPSHPDLKANLWREAGTGHYGWDFVKGSANPGDEHGHGTHVSGIIGAQLNREAGISGVAHKVSIMAVRYYSEKASGAQNLKNSIRALNWAIDHGAQIINYSGGGPEFSMDEYVAIKRAREKGVLIVAAAGNEKSNVDSPENYYYPCAYRLDNIVCVAATNIRNSLLTSSNWGKAMVDVAAPGENILSTVPGKKYAYMSGTSQATAFVSGVAALLKSKNRNLSPAQMKGLLRSAVDGIGALDNKVAAAGKINAAKALAALDRVSAPLPLASAGPAGESADAAVAARRTAGKPKGLADAPVVPAKKPKAAVSDL